MRERACRVYQGSIQKIDPCDPIFDYQHPSSLEHHTERLEHAFWYTKGAGKRLGIAVRQQIIYQTLRLSWYQCKEEDRIPTKEAW